ncbi:hypothetical protein BBJ28_00022474 [Nothophytophthora sp. Chile5]|nr:hypothetical protein BBJ28_00022474 [Nothophytophthora sp. Chile5]
MHYSGRYRTSSFGYRCIGFNSNSLVYRCIPSIDAAWLGGHRNGSRSLEQDHVAMELLLLRIDHFRDRKRYLSVLRTWLAELGIANGRVITMGSVHLLFLAASEDQNAQLLAFYRARDIDSNSRDELCVDKFIDVLGRKAVESTGCKGFLEMNVLKVLVQEWHAEQAWLDSALATPHTKAFLEWKETAKLARKERRKRVGLGKQQERDAKKQKREQEEAVKALESPATEEQTSDSENATKQVDQPEQEQEQETEPQRQEQPLDDGATPATKKKRKNKKRRNQKPSASSKIES